MLSVATPPPWVQKGAYIDLDFANGRYWGGEVFRGQGTKKIGLIDGSQHSGSQYTLREDGLYEPNTGGNPRITKGYGLWAEESRNFPVLWCRDLSNAAWTKSNMTASKNLVGIDGVANTATTLTATATNATVSQAVTMTSQLCVSSVFLKRVAGTGTVEISQDGGSIWTDVTAALAAGSTLRNGWVRVSLASQTLTNPTVMLRLGTSGDAVGADFFCLEHAYVGGQALISPVGITSPLLTTSAAGIRATEEPTFNTATTNPNDGLRLIKNVFVYGGPWAFKAKFSGSPTATKNGWIISSDGNAIIFGGCGTAFSYQTAATSNTGNVGVGNWNIGAGRTNGFGSVACLNGGPISTLSTSSKIGRAHV